MGIRQINITDEEKAQIIRGYRTIVDQLEFLHDKGAIKHTKFGIAYFAILSLADRIDSVMECINRQDITPEDSEINRETLRKIIDLAFDSQGKFKLQSWHHFD